MSINSLYRPIKLIDLGLIPLTTETARNSTERLMSRAVPKPNAPIDIFDIPAFLRRQAT